MTGPQQSGSAAGAVYEINDGVRRAKAAVLTGKETIPANGGDTFAVTEVPLDRIRSGELKPVIDISSPDAEARWNGVLRGIIGGNPIEPIHVVEKPQSTGVPIREVPIVKGGRPVDPFTGA
jgi:hypothetical protein